MKATPLFLGACALASIVGAVGGTTINTSPLQGAGLGSAMIAQRAVVADASDYGHQQEILPDHYAMTTPEGRIDVSDLANRGLYAQQRYGWQTATYEEPVEPELAPENLEDLGLEEPASLPDNAHEAAGPPLDLATPTNVQVTPRMIDVAAVLAVRN